MSRELSWQITIALFLLWNHCTKSKGCFFPLAHSKPFLCSSSSPPFSRRTRRINPHCSICLRAACVYFRQGKVRICALYFSAAKAMLNAPVPSCCDRGLYHGTGLAPQWGQTNPEATPMSDRNVESVRIRKCVWLLAAETLKMLTAMTKPVLTQSQNKIIRSKIVLSMVGSLSSQRSHQPFS